MLKLRAAAVVAAGAPDAPEQQLTIELDGERREAIADTALMGACQVGDEVIVNVHARDLGLGSGGFDVVHVNLTRGLRGEGVPGAHVMKLNYTSLQHAVEPVEAGDPQLPLRGPVAALARHGQLAPVAWAFAQARPGGRLGFVQTEGGALPGGHSRTVAELTARGLLAGHVTAGAAFGGAEEAVTLAGALAHGLGGQGWDAAVCGPGPGIVGSASALGHGGMRALDSCHTALALGCSVVLIARMSSADPRPRHRGISHHTLTVLDLLLAPVTVAFPTGDSLPGEPAAGPQHDHEHEPAALRDRLARHDCRRLSVDVPGYARAGLSPTTMGRTLEQDPLFFAAALAGGGALGALAGGEAAEAAE